PGSCPPVPAPRFLPPGSCPLRPDGLPRSGAWIPNPLERITARRAEPDEPEEQPAKQSAQVQAERNEPAVTEHVLERVNEQLANERASLTPAPRQVGRRAVTPIPHRTSGAEETTLPPDYQRIPTAVRQAAGPVTGPVTARHVGDAPGTDVSMRAKPEPLRRRPVRLVDRSQLRKPPDGRFTTCP
ncbi:hypothetical protein ABT404_18955, partial [Streptomyces hyaluromycini]